MIAYFAQWAVYQRALARELGMAESTIARWVSGASRPHPAFQAVVIARIGKKAEADALHKVGTATSARLGPKKAYKQKKNASAQKGRAKAG